MRSLNLPAPTAWWTFTRATATCHRWAIVIDATLQATWFAPQQTGLVQETKLTVDRAVLDHLQALSTSAQASAMTKAIVRVELAKVRTFAAEKGKDNALDAETRAFYGAAFEAGGGTGATGGARGGATAAPAAAAPGRRAESDTIPAGAPI